MYIQLMPTQSLPVGDTALGSGTHTDAQHTVTGECVHITPFCSSSLPGSTYIRMYLLGREVFWLGQFCRMCYTETFSVTNSFWQEYKNCHLPGKRVHVTRECAAKQYS